MSSQPLVIQKNSMKICKKLFISSMASLFFFACRKDDITPKFNTVPPRPVNMNLSASKLILLQGNESKTAITLNWGSAQDGHNEKVTYIIESAAEGAQFADPVEMGSSDQLSAFFTVKDFNSKMCKLIIPGTHGRVEFRVKIVKPCAGNSVVYSDAIALDVTPYQPFIEYESSKIIRIPGNFQNWKVASAPKVISSKIAGEYEGYVQFTNPYSQFLMVKGSTEWDPKVTYNYIGANKFGFGGSMFSIFGGAGIYRLQVNTNTNTWAYTKINSWGLNGSAVSGNANTDAAMIFDETTSSWSITTNLAKGDFRFRANNSNAINFGHNASTETGIPDYNGEAISIAKAGSYTITLNLTEAGNYVYGVMKNYL